MKAGTSKGSKSSASTGSSAAAKKKKKKPRFWTPEEDAYLREAIGKYGVDGYESWKKVAADVPDRSYRECMQRWTKVLTPGLRKGKWDPAEDRELTALVKNQLQLLGEGNKKRIVWSQISKSFGGRSCKQCRERWINHLDPSVKKSEWTPDEDKCLLALAQVHPHKWAKIAREIPGRTENMVKVRWNALNRVKKEDANKSKRKTEKKSKVKAESKVGKPRAQTLPKKGSTGNTFNASATVSESISGSNTTATNGKENDFNAFVEEDRDTFLDPLNGSGVEPLSPGFVNNSSYVSGGGNMNLKSSVVSGSSHGPSGRRASALMSAMQIWNQEEDTDMFDHLAEMGETSVNKPVKSEGKHDGELSAIPNIKSANLSSWPKSGGRRRMSSKKQDIFGGEEMDEFLFDESTLGNVSFTRKFSYTNGRKMSGFALPNINKGADGFHALPNLNKVVTSLNGGLTYQEDAAAGANYASWLNPDSDAKREREASRRESVMLWANDPKKSKNGRRRSSLLRFAPSLDPQDEIPAFNHSVIPEIEEKGTTKAAVDTDGSIRRMSNKLSQLFILDFDEDGSPAQAVQL